jgi:hypothetical protein
MSARSGSSGAARKPRSDRRKASATAITSLTSAAAIFDTSSTDIDRRLALTGAGEQEGDEGIGLLDGDPLAIAEDLLELVRHDQQGRALQPLGPLDDLDQSEGTAPQRRLKESRGFFAVSAGSEDIG